ncbi:MAG TPA: 2,3-epoxybenzoyl-CoA dihydrolase [Candidatus Binataceae bacterium]|nr:2,3-epoxybenzoyl-CoA dihydrolase [Candidatus Binataceae bacterium]
MINFRTSPSHYRHWKIIFDGPIATLLMNVDETGGINPGYELKLNSYDLGVDVELYDATQRLRFEHPEICCVIITSAKERVFCAGANIKMLGHAEHSFKVNFCKFTNETRFAIEDASENSHQNYIAVINGSCAGGGYELALATEHILMADDGSTTISLPEVPLLGVLPGTGGLTRLVDKRKVRRDHADFFCTTEEGIRSGRALEWGLVDEVVPRSRLAEATASRAAAYVLSSERPVGAKGLELTPLECTVSGDRIDYRHVSVALDRARSLATITVRAPRTTPINAEFDTGALDDSFWPLAFARELEDAILHLRFNEEAVGIWVFRAEGEAGVVEAYDNLLTGRQDHWLAREIVLYLKRVLKRLDVSARSLFTLIEPGSCFTGSLLELALASDRVYMLSGTREDEELPAATIGLGPMNFGLLPMGNGLSRLQSRFLGDPVHVEKLRGRIGEPIDTATAAQLGLVGFTPDDIDWDDEVRLALESRAAFSPDALTGLEASLRFAGPETMETKIFARLSAWQNWIFQRPNAVGERGALKLYGSGKRATFDPRRT